MDFQPLTALLDTLHQQGIPAMEVVVCRDHRVLYHQCLGHADVAATRPATAQDRYWLYSCTKPLLVTAAMRAVEEGLLQLDDAVAQYLPAYGTLRVPTQAGSRPAYTKLLVRHLFTMTGGLDYALARPGLQALPAAHDPRPLTTQVAESFAAQPLSFDPGARFQYSLCHDVLGAVVEQASGMTLAHYLQSRLFDPLGMQHTAFGGTACPQGLSAQYRYDEQSRTLAPCTWQNEYVLKDGYCSGGAGVVATASDYARFADALACGGVGSSNARILQRESIDLLRRALLFPGESNQFFCTAGSEYGYGLGVRTRIACADGLGNTGEFGWDGAAGANLLIDPAEALSMVFVQHIRNWPAMVGEDLHVRLRRALYTALAK